MEKATANDALLDALFRIKDSIVAVDNELTITYVNQAFADAVGLKVKEMLGKKIPDLLPKSEPFMHNQIIESRRTKKVLNFEWTGPYASVFLETTIFPSANGVTIISRDITKRRKAEEALKTSEAQFHSLYDNSLDAILLTIPEGGVLSANPAAQKLFGMNESEIMKRGREDLVIVNERLRKAVKERVNNGKATAELTLKRKDGSTFEGEVTSSVFKDANGTTKTSMIIRDITERKKAEQALKENQELFEIAFHNSPAALIITNLEDNRIRDVNQSLLSLLEYDREEIINHTTRELGIFPDYSSREELVGLMLKKGTVQNREVELKTKTGKPLECVLSLKLINIRRKKHFLSSVIDITEYRRMQAKLENYSSNLEKIVDERTTQLKNSERLAAIGLTAGMVGHDIRNPLQAILADVYLLKECLTTMPDHNMKNDIAESLDEIDKNISYINKIVADLQDYARPLNPTYTGVDVSEIMTNIVKTAGIPDNIQVEVVSNTFKKIKTDPTFIRRILTNLVTNAIQAMPDGGNIELACFSKADKYYVSVSDTGNGIPDEFKPKLFLPMMTTKAKGQGLGLAVAKRLVEAVNGKIEFESKEGEGTKFTIELPFHNV